ncbi:hypothetical protein IWW37_004772 [Coemansia sp. RSA 2050]|nr:hypothetical protein IWW37_004772 [Coemansia sp. RSA 2050]KAJ2733010.1 hypothetical protein IW152_003417 [Coemansia sp. BCRC 34962]
MDSSSVVARATLVLHLYATTQIDQLLAIASSDLAQRWDFLGPQAKDFASAEFFSEVDTALQWRENDLAIGDIIRHSHFALELTEEQAETLCQANVRFDVESGRAHALAPFATGGADNESLTLAVDLVMEDSEWRYFDIVACKGSISELQSPRGSELHSSYEEACASIPSDPAKSAEEDDDYWGQYSDDEKEEEEEEEEEKAAAPTEHCSSAHLIAEAGKHALLSAAAAMRALGSVSEEQFVDYARRAFRGEQHDG